MIDLHLFALNCNESFRIVVDEKEKRAKLCCLTLSILVFYVKCFIINLLGPPDAYSNVCISLIINYIIAVFLFEFTR